MLNKIRRKIDPHHTLQIVKIILEESYWILVWVVHIFFAFLSFLKHRLIVVIFLDTKAVFISLNRTFLCVWPSKNCVSEMSMHILYINTSYSEEYNDFCPLFHFNSSINQVCSISQLLFDILVTILKWVYSGSSLLRKTPQPLMWVAPFYCVTIYRQSMLVIMSCILHLNAEYYYRTSIIFFHSLFMVDCWE